jgi:hypothetical protein
MPTIENTIEHKRSQIAQLEADIADLERAQSLINAFTSKRGQKKGTGKRGRPPGKKSVKAAGKKNREKGTKASAKSKKGAPKPTNKSKETALEPTDSQ